jgi:hypothetical protein
MESGLNWTILQPCHFMQPAMIKAIINQERPVFHAGFNPDIPFSFLSLGDLGEAASIVINEREKHYFAQYPLASTIPTSYRQVIQLFAKKLGQEIDIQQAPLEKAADNLLNSLTGDKPVHPRMRDAAQRMLLFYNYRGLVGNPNILGWLLKRSPTKIDAWLDQEIAAAGKN